MVYVPLYLSFLHCLHLHQQHPSDPPLLKDKQPIRSPPQTINNVLSISPSESVSQNRCLSLRELPFAFHTHTETERQRERESVHPLVREKTLWQPQVQQQYLSSLPAPPGSPRQTGEEILDAQKMENGMRGGEEKGKHIKCVLGRESEKERDGNCVCYCVRLSRKGRKGKLLCITHEELESLHSWNHARRSRWRTALSHTQEVRNCGSPQEV